MWKLEGQFCIFAKNKYSYMFKILQMSLIE